ncbi:MAG: alpha/beta hydrolase [Rhodospirillaceae bacterium]|nr:alpha/beta hydrolase [Rhodospirillaceae bacterium]MBT6119397.1 alpha/beta hydrolase [Rhodospirillaceae bacterium]
MRIYREYDQAGLDAQYDNRAMVPEFADHLAAWKRGSEAARSDLPHRIDLAYGPHERERLDFFPADPGAPLHLFIHGGYWRAMDKADFAFPAPAYVQAGIAYGAIGYPLAPEASLDRIAGSIGRALKWVLEHAADLAVDPRRILLSGHSAGGHLAAMARSDTDLGPRLRGILAISGLYDLEPIRLSYLNTDLGLDAAGARRAGPIHLAPPAGGAATLAVGGKESDEYHRQQDAYGEHLTAEGVPVAQLDLAGHDHFSILQALSAPDGPLFAAVAAAIED